MQHSPIEPHLTADVVAALVDGTLAPSDREAAEAHLSNCDSCAQEVMEVQRGTARAPGPRVRSLAWWAAAAAVALFVLAVGLRRQTPSAPPLRGTAGDAGRTLVAVAPPEQASLPPEQVVFVWRALAPGARYRLTVTTGQGAAIWSASTSDTALALAPDIPLVPGTYYWYVDALSLDGRSVTTRARSLLLSP